ncbi:MAG: hypothetical protein KJP18_13030, partial [Gemmatimonadetes bacterium]|nr:hypothetical protein [Gemmatimonadota bacterium]
PPPLSPSSLALPVVSALVALAALTAAGPLASAEASQEGELTIVFDGAPRTLPIDVEASSWSPPGSGTFDDPRRTRIAIRAGDWPGAAVRGGGWNGTWSAPAEPAASLRVDFDAQTLEVARGNSQLSDSRAVDDRAALGRLGTADSDQASTSALSVTIEEYDERGDAVFVRGRFDAPDTGLSGTFQALLPAVR